ncbi:hypothetical protein K431DRAFT_314229 [Polychaeton citri CBS 116435]|uniref:Amino acid transporter n=1 Tax=Polychaeton citri CBS 116435 TaxID=1314669 RepID=A0A9P4Q4A7_9PEZI|nr:hypothetical protein K431DRAFT_314229 [Polychaeton citri CBS 116435]
MADNDPSAALARHHSAPDVSPLKPGSSINKTNDPSVRRSVPEVTITEAPSRENVAGQSQSRLSVVDKTASQDATERLRHDDDDRSFRPNPTFDDRNTVVPERNLGKADVAALVFNKMVGTGIFTTPALVLALTQSKGVGIGMWVAAGLYTGLSLLNYLQIGTWFPYNGGELIYLDRIYPAGFLFTLFFAGTHLAFPLTVGNCIAFARFVTIAAQPSYRTDADLDERVTKIIAIFALFSVCVILAASAKFGMFLNKSLALFKFFLLIIVFCRGFATSGNASAPQEFIAPDNQDTSAWSYMGAFVLVVYSYSGWENANYVAGELREASEGRTGGSLVFGAMGAVLATTLLYVLVVVAYYSSGNQQEIIQFAQSFGMGAIWEANGEKVGFAHSVFGGDGRAFRVLIAASAYGNLISVVYTSAKVKQAIARQRILPFWQFFQGDKHTPKGGLFLHFFINVIWIASLPMNTDGYSFVIGISTWGRIFMEMLVMFGLPFLLLRGMPPDLLSRKSLIWPLSLLIALFNLVIIICAAAQHGKDIIARFWWPVVIAGVFAITLLYWGAIQILNRPAKASPPRSDGIQMHPTGERQPLALSTGIQTIGQKVGIEVSVYEKKPKVEKDWPVNMDAAMAEAELDGTNRRIVAKIGEPFVPVAVRKTWERTVELFVRYLC